MKDLVIASDSLTLAGYSKVLGPWADILAVAAVYAQTGDSGVPDSFIRLFSYREAMQ